MNRKISIFLTLVLFLASCNLPGGSYSIAESTAVPIASVTIPTSIPTMIPTVIVPTKTPIPVGQITSAEEAVFNGDYSKATDEFQNILLSTDDETFLASAIWGLGKTNFLLENYPTVLENLRELTQKYPESEQSKFAWFLLGETYFNLERYQEAIEAYQNYLTYQPILLVAYVQEKCGESFSAVGDYLSAQNAYMAAEISPGQKNTYGIRIKVASTYLNSNNPEAALKIYDEILASTSDDYNKAQLDLLSGRALLALNRIEEGYGKWNHAVENYPLAYDSYSALVGLVEANQPVDEFNRGLVDYYAGQYDVALRAFQSYRDSNPNHDGTVLHYLALTLREMGDYQSAVDIWQLLIDKYPGNRFWETAWDDITTTKWVYLDEYAAAAEQLELFASQNPGSSLVITYLNEAARIYERSGELEKAASLWESLPARFGSDPSLANVWFLAGIVRFRQEEYAKANNDFQQSVLLSKEQQDRARALLWVGKTFIELGDATNANSAWEQSQIADPEGYYSLRARELLESRKPFIAPIDIFTDIDLKTERADAASWLRIKLDLPSNTDLNDLGKIRNDLRFQRGVEFWNLGLYDQARLEFEDIRESIKDNPQESFRFGNYLLDLGAYRSAIYALRDALNSVGLDEHSASLTAPVYFNHVRYGLYYSDIVWKVATENKFDPLFLTSVMRQESLFEGFVRSKAGARGLMQIMPATGFSISNQMGWPQNFGPADLYSPYVSIRLGADYLDSNRTLLDGDYYAVLAAYNSGPGNASIWQQLSNGDQDLELEIIRYSETRNYIRGIFEIYTTYRRFYSPMQ